MKSIFFLVMLVVLGGGLAWFSKEKKTAPTPPNNLEPSSMQITSSAFSEEGSIPPHFTCDGDGINPPLTFSGVPAEAKSLALIMEDPDVPKDRMPSGLFVHWITWNISPATTTLPEHSLPTGAMEGLNGSGKPGYTGPCPPDKEHRYFFRLYALDTLLKLSPLTTKVELEHAFEGHTVATATLMGRYNRPR